MALVRQLTTAGFRLISKYKIYRTPALKVLIGPPDDWLAVLCRKT